MSFTDLPTTHTYYPDITRLANLGMVAGYPDGTVHPDEAISFGRLCAMLSRQLFRDKVERDVLEKVLPAVLTMVTQLPDGKSGQGTGFFISPNTIATNEHVVKGGTKFTAYGALGQLTLTLKALTDIQDLQDLALLESPTPSPAWLKLREKPVYQGMHIGVLGTPIGLPNTFTQGVVSHLNRESWTGRLDWFQTDAAVNPGNSGGPIIDGRGEVCGVTVAKVMATGIEGLAYGVKVDRLKRFAEAMGVKLDA